MIDKAKIDDGKEYSGTASAERAALAASRLVTTGRKTSPRCPCERTAGEPRDPSSAERGRALSGVRADAYGEPAGGVGRPGGASGRRVAPRERRLSSQAGREPF